MTTKRKNSLTTDLSEGQPPPGLDTEPSYDFSTGERKGPAIPQGPDFGKAPPAEPETKGRVERTDDRKPPAKKDLAKMASSAVVLPPGVERYVPTAEEELEAEKTAPAPGGRIVNALREMKVKDQREREAAGDFTPTEDAEVVEAARKLKDDFDERLAKAAAVAIVNAPKIPFEPLTLGVRMVPLSELVPCAKNPRKDLGDLSELKASISQVGVLQPLLARPLPLRDGPADDCYELVFGHRRLAAARELGLQAVPVDVRELTDAQVLEAQLVENGQRKDIHPMEEAEAYERLHKEFGYSADQIAEKVGKSKRWVYARMQLCALGPEGRKALQDDKLTASVALLVARIPSTKLQAEAVGELAASKDQDAASFRESLEVIHSRYTTELRGAPFDQKDALLVPEVGSCVKCPKRSGSNPDLFDDLKRADVCTDVVCFRNKVDAAWEVKAERARDQGKKVLSPTEGKKIFKFGAPSWGSPWLVLDAAAPDDRKRRTWRELLIDNPKVKEKPAIHFTCDGHGKTHDLVDRKEAFDALEKAGVTWAAEKKEEEIKRAPKSKEDQAAAELEQKVRDAVTATVIAKAAEHAEAAGATDAVMRLMCLGLGNTFGLVDEVLNRRKITDLEATVKKLSGKALIGLAFELSVQAWASDGYREYSDELKALAKTFGINIPAIEKATRSTLTAESLFDVKAKDTTTTDAPKKGKKAEARA